MPRRLFPKKIYVRRREAAPGAASFVVVTGADSIKENETIAVYTLQYTLKVEGGLNLEEL